MKRVFSSNSQVCHIWANQSQSEGRASSIFFDGTKIYSYGRHYLAGEIHKRGSVKFALVNSFRYSVTTAKHLSWIRSALNIPYFESPDPSNVSEAVIFADGQAQASIARALKRMRIESQEDIQREFNHIHAAFSEATALRRILKRAEIWPKQSQLDEVEKHLRKRLARYNELNPPEVLAARAAERARIEEAQDRQRDADLQHALSEFYSGARHSVWGLSYEALRLDGDVIRTSAGAEVPVSEAKRLLADLLAGKQFLETRIGHFRFQSIDRTLEDPIVKIGCHNIRLSEAIRVVGPLLKNGAA